MLGGMDDMNAEFWAQMGAEAADHEYREDLTEADRALLPMVLQLST